MPTHAFTIRKLADAAGVGVEAVRYYHERGLLPERGRSEGGFREYAPSDVQRLQFIRRAQELGFTLDDVDELLSLSAQGDRPRVRAVTQRRIAEIRGRIAQLGALTSVLEGLVEGCEGGRVDEPCPIVAALTDGPTPADTGCISDNAGGSQRRAVARVPKTAGAVS